MTSEVLVIEESELLLQIEDAELLVDTVESLELLETAEQGPPGFGDNSGADGQIWTIQDGVPYWDDPAPSGVDPAALAAALAFAAAHG